MLPALDVSTSALVANRVRMNVISGNLANLSTTHNERGEPQPYQPKFVIFQADDSIGVHGAAGVRVAAVETDQVEPNYKYQPNHPDAIKDGPHKGCVAYPAVDMIAEFTDAMEAARAYEANLGAMDIAKDLQQQTLKIIA